MLSAVLQCTYLSVKSTLMPRGLILVHKPFARHAVEHWYGIFVCGFCRRFIASFDGIHDFLHMSTHHRAHTGVAYAVFFRLTGAFSGLGGISQFVSPTRDNSKTELNSIDCDNFFVNSFPLVLHSRLPDDR